MELIFKAENHKYESIKDPSKKWLSATGIIDLFKEPFDQEAVAIKCSKSKKGKWFGMTPKEIINYWDNESKRATDLGTWYHNQREEDLLACETVRRNGIDLPIVPFSVINGVKYSPHQSLTPGIYPEHFVYLKSASICGQADRVEIVGDKVDIYDYKTNKEVKTTPYTNWEGVTKTLLGPLSHLGDCDISKYAIQLSIYMYIILKHNPHLKPGKLEIDHIVFEIESKDKNGFPIVATDAAGDPIIKEVVPYDLPYLEDEVKTIIMYLKDHPELFKPNEVEND